MSKPRISDAEFSEMYIAACYVDAGVGKFAGVSAQDAKRLVLDLQDTRALLAKLNGVQFDCIDERVEVIAEVSAYLAGGECD